MLSTLKINHFFISFSFKIRILAYSNYRMWNIWLSCSGVLLKTLCPKFLLVRKRHPIHGPPSFNFFVRGGGLNVLFEIFMIF